MCNSSHILNCKNRNPPKLNVLSLSIGTTKTPTEPKLVSKQIPNQINNLCLVWFGYLNFFVFISEPNCITKQGVDICMFRFQLGFQKNV